MKRTTREEFIFNSNKIHLNVFDYSEVNYINTHTKVEIICKVHGSFYKSPKEHLKGSGCNKCKIRKPLLTRQEFENKARDIHGDKYDYSKSCYINNKMKIEIFCKNHGAFFQKPNNHLLGQGCPECGNISKAVNRIKTTEEFIEDAIKIHGNLYNYDLVEYLLSSKKIKIICNTHGIFEQKPNSHLQGYGCKKCMGEKISKSKEKSPEDFINECKKRHKDRYLYEKTKYKGCDKKVIVTCRIHGDFEQQASNHLHGQGCDKCGKESHWRRSDYIKKANGRICTFYVLKCFNEKEEFYKIGITMNTIKSRYSTIKEMPYNYEIVSEVYGETGIIWDTELRQKRKLKDFNYQPKIKFDGSKTECFTKYEINEE